MQGIIDLVEAIRHWHLNQLRALRRNALWLIIFALLPLPICMIWGGEIGKKWPVAIGDLIAIAGVLYYGARRAGIIIEVTAALRKLAVNADIAASIIWAVGAFIETVTWVLKSVPTIGLLALLLPVERDAASAILAGVAGIIFAASAISKKTLTTKWDTICNITAAFTLLISLFLMAFPSDEEWSRVGVTFAAEQFLYNYGAMIRFGGVILMAIIAAYFCLRGRGERSANPTRAAGVIRPAAKKGEAGGSKSFAEVVGFLAGIALLWVTVMTITGRTVTPWSNELANIGHFLLMVTAGAIICWLFAWLGKTWAAWGVFGWLFSLTLFGGAAASIIIYGNPTVKAACKAAGICL